MCRKNRLNDENQNDHLQKWSEDIDQWECCCETGDNDGIKHTWVGYVDASYYRANFTWTFDWEDLRNQGIDRLVGCLIMNGHWAPHRVDIDWTEANQSILAAFGSSNLSYNVTFEYRLTAHFAPPPEKMCYDEIFAASDKTDLVLVVEGKKLNVNKTFLSIHSDYFKTLFSSNFKEGQME
ncbi:unnamed protein product [Caenorhabditis nigoni]